MKTADFDFYLPKNLIALRPSEMRDHSRLLVLHRDSRVDHRRFSDILHYLKEGDMLLLNNTKVFPARIIGTKHSGGKIDILLVREMDGDSTWEIMYRGNYTGIVTIGDNIKAEIWTEDGQGSEHKKFLRFLGIDHSMVKNMLWRFGYMPLPSYIRRMPDKEDKQRYQTVYAESQGSIAAPTAGLHFTEELIRKIIDKGVLVRVLTLHVGIGTFKPIKTDIVENHTMDSEFFEIESSVINEIQSVKESRGKIIAVGTTATRAVEGYTIGQWSEVRGQEKVNGSVRGYTDIFIYPGYEFKAVDSLITNFHLPRSTPLMLASALCGFEKILMAYKEAIAIGYRFFSYGDAMLIL